MGLPGGVFRRNSYGAPLSHPLSGKRVLVTGASGFLGGRLAERLFVECGAEVRVLVRRVFGAVRLARYPIEIVVGDVTDRESVTAAAHGCQVIFNCTKGKGGDATLRRAVDVHSLRHLVETARERGARLVHVSTMAVYDQPREGEFDERTPASSRGDYYSDAKLEGERLALALGAQRGVPVTVIQPTIVYGPYSDIHGSEILEELRTSRMILVNGGTGVCNAVYVDDVVTAMLLAATSDCAPGERFLISGPEYPTWREFFGAFEQMLGVGRTLTLSEKDALDLWRRSQRRRWLLPETLRAIRENRDLRRRLLSTKEGAVVRAVGERWLPESVRTKVRESRQAAAAELPIQPLRPGLIHNLARRARARTDKARELLGYEPVFSLERGMSLTRAWAQWAGLLDGQHEQG